MLPLTSTAQKAQLEPSCPFQGEVDLVYTPLPQLAALKRVFGNTGTKEKREIRIVVTSLNLFRFCLGHNSCILTHCQEKEQQELLTLCMLSLLELPPPHPPHPPPVNCMMFTCEITKAHSYGICNKKSGLWWTETQLHLIPHDLSDIWKNATKTQISIYVGYFFYYGR